MLHYLSHFTTPAPMEPHLKSYESLSPLTLALPPPKTPTTSRP